MILIIDNYDSFVYNLYQNIALLHTDVEVIRNDKISLADIQRMQPSAIILSPGPGRPEDAGICVELIRAFHTTTPILGVCLGLQAIAIAFGGQVIQAPEIIHGKPERIFHNQRGIYQNLSLPFQAGRYHSLMVERSTLPHTFMIDAESTAGLIMGIRHVEYPLFGVQFHPESILTPMGHRLLKNFVGGI